MNRLTILTGRTNAGKTEALLQRMHEVLLRGERAILLLPEPNTYDGERMLLQKTAKPLFHAEVLGFSRLSEKILAFSGGKSRQFLSAEGRRMALRRMIEELSVQ